jgi:hypothetical protein
VRRKTAIILSISLIVALLVAACDIDTGDSSTPVPPAARTGNDAIDAQRAEGLKPDCSKYATWEECP